MLNYADPHFSPRKFAGLAFVAALHVAIIYALLNGMGEQVVQVLRQPLETRIIQAARLPPPEAPPPPPPKLLVPPPPFIPPPLVQIAQQPQVRAVIATVTRIKPVAAPPPPVPAPSPPIQPKVARRGAALDPNQTCAPPQYPQAAYDMDQTGTSVVQFLISATGTVIDSKVAGSSGHASLDEAAIAALSQCKFKPAIGADGNPQESWVNIRYVWQVQ